MTHRAKRISDGAYLYRGVEIRQDHDSEDYRGWWATYSAEGETEDYWPTLRQAKAIIDADLD